MQWGEQAMEQEVAQIQNHHLKDDYEHKVHYLLLAIGFYNQGKYHQLDIELVFHYIHLLKLEFLMYEVEHL